VVYESKHRIIKFLEELGKMANDENKKVNLTSIVVVRELSKMYETVYRGSLESIKEKIQNDPNAQKGEFVVIIGK